MLKVPILHSKSVVPSMVYQSMGPRVEHCSFLIRVVAMVVRIVCWVNL